jgi:hypothetical protein
MSPVKSSAVTRSMSFDGTTLPRLRAESPLSRITEVHNEHLIVMHERLSRVEEARHELWKEMGVSHSLELRPKPKLTAKRAHSLCRD